MSLFSITCLVGFIAPLTAALLLILKGRDREYCILLGLAFVASSAWSAGAYMFSITFSEETALFWTKIAHVGVILSPAFYFHFVCRWTERYTKGLIFFVYFLAAFFLGCNFFYKNFISIKFSFNQFYFFNYDISINPLYFIFYVIFYWLILFYALFLLVKFFQNSVGGKRNQIKYIIISSLIAWLGPEGMFLYGIFKMPLYPYSNIFISINPLIFTYAILKYRLLDIRVFISRAVAFLISYPIFLGIPFFFAYRMYPFLYPAMGINWWLAPSGLIVFFASMAPLAYGQIRSRMENKLLAEQKRYQNLLLQAAKGMATEHNLKKLAKLIAYIVKRAVKIDFAAIFLDEKKDGNYTLKAIRDSGRNLYKDTTFSKNDPFVAYAKKIENPFLYEEMPQAVKASLGMPPQVSLIVPSGVEGNLLGFVLLGEKLNRQAYTEEDMGVFKILSHQAALAVENCLFLEEFKQAQEKIFTAEKLASIGGMADGVAHQIKNRLNQFSVASGELKYEITDFMKKNSKTMAGHPECKKSFKYMLEIADSLIGNVKKTDGIVKGILNFARVEEKETFFSKFSLNEIIKLSNELLCVKHEISQVPLKVEVGARDSIFGVKSQIMEVIYNLLDNGFEAIDEKKAIFRNQGKPEFQEQLGIKLINTRLYYHIEVSDNGIGVEQADSPKLFAPFFTTKSSHKSGTGIGLYVVRRMVEENHKGKIWFVSKHMEGTTFHIDLPKKH